MIQTRTGLLTRPASWLVVAWTLLVFIALIFSIFLHEDGHGIGAKLDGVPTSTGFNRIGNPGRLPTDPDFRTGYSGGVMTGLLGPVTSWLLAAVFTIWFHRFRQPTMGAFIVGALAVANGLARAVPMLRVLLCAAGGKVEMEDEVHWGLWYIGKVLRPDLGLDAVRGLAVTQPDLLLSYAPIWITVLISFAISLVCLFFAYRHLAVLTRGQPLRGLFVLTPLAAWVLVLPLLNVLDQLIRINW